MRNIAGTRRHPFPHTDIAGVIPKPAIVPSAPRCPTQTKGGQIRIER